MGCFFRSWLRPVFGEVSRPKSDSFSHTMITFELARGRQEYEIVHFFGWAPSVRWHLYGAETMDFSRVCSSQVSAATRRGSTVFAVGEAAKTNCLATLPDSRGAVFVDRGFSCCAQRRRGIRPRCRKNRPFRSPNSQRLQGRNSRRLGRRCPNQRRKCG